MTARRPPATPPAALPDSGNDAQTLSPEGADAKYDAGDPACWAGLLCLDCGAVLSEGHQRGCPRGESR